MTAATAILAFVTFVLAIAAFINIRLNRRIQAKERRDRQLREVVDWAVDAVKAPLLVETPSLRPESAGVVQAEMQGFVRSTMASDLLEEGRHVALILASGEYIKNLAGHLDGSLASAVENAFSTLTEHHEALIDATHEWCAASGDLRAEYERLIAPTVQSWQSVQDSAKAIISRATELLTT